MTLKLTKKLQCINVWPNHADWVIYNVFSSRKINIFSFQGLFFTKTSISQKNVWIFSRATTRGRKLKFGMDDPYYMFFKIGHPFGDIFFRFWAMWIFVSLLPQNAHKTGVFSHIWGNSETKIHIAQKRKKISPNGCPILKNI